MKPLEEVKEELTIDTCCEVVDAVYICEKERFKDEVNYQDGWDQKKFWVTEDDDNNGFDTIEECYTYITSKLQDEIDVACESLDENKLYLYKHVMSSKKDHDLEDVLKWLYEIESYDLEETLKLLAYFDMYPTDFELITKDEDSYSIVHIGSLKDYVKEELKDLYPDIPIDWFDIDYVVREFGHRYAECTAYTHECECFVYGD